METSAIIFQAWDFFSFQAVNFVSYEIYADSFNTYNKDGSILEKFIDDNTICMINYDLTNKGFHKNTS